MIKKVEKLYWTLSTANIIKEKELRKWGKAVIKLMYYNYVYKRKTKRYNFRKFGFWVKITRLIRVHVHATMFVSIQYSLYIF